MVFFNASGTHFKKEGVVRQKKKEEKKRTNIGVWNSDPSKEAAAKFMTGFKKPVRICTELVHFFKSVAGHEDIDEGCFMTRLEVTRRLNEYIQTHGLRNTEDLRVIDYTKDDEFSKLIKLRPEDNNRLTYFNLQVAIKHLFVV